GVTWGYLASEDILQKIPTAKIYDSALVKDWNLSQGEIDLTLVNQDQMTLKQSMWNYVGIIRSKNRLNRARAMFRELQDEVSRFYKHSVLHDNLIGLRNGIEVA